MTYLDSELFNRKVQLIKGEGFYEFVIFPQIEVYAFSFLVAIITLNLLGIWFCLFSVAGVVAGIYYTKKSLVFHTDEERISITRTIFNKYTLSGRSFHYLRPLNLYIKMYHDDDRTHGGLFIKDETVHDEEYDTMLVTTNDLDALMDIRELINSNELIYADSKIKIL